MSHFRIFYQNEQEDCGVACLSMILYFYGFRVTPKAIKVFCGNLKSGLTLYELNCAAKQIGFKTQAVRLNAEELLCLSQDFFPFVSYWNYNHFVVVYKATSQYIYVADPALGRIKYRHSDFFEKFALSDGIDGFALLLKPENIDRSILKFKNRKGINLNQYIKSRKKQLALAAISLIVLSLIGFLFPFLTKAVVDKGIANKDTGVLLVILCATLALAVGRVLFSFFQSRMTLVAGSLIDIDLAKDLLSRLSALPMKFFDSRKVGDIIQRVSDVSRIGNYYASRLAESTLSFVMFCIYGGILFHYYSLLFWIFLCGVILYIGYMFLFVRRCKLLDYEFFNTAARSQEELIQFLRGMMELKIAHAEIERLSVWRDCRYKLFEVSRRNLTLLQKQELGCAFIYQVINAISIYLMATAVIENNTTFGTLMAVQYIVGSMEAPLHSFTSFIRETQSMRNALSRINYIVAEEVEQSGSEHVDFTNDTPSICIKGVTFDYNNNSLRPALQNISANIPSCKTTALVGMSGSGKTTLLKLLLGLYSPDEGTITINNKLLSEIDLSIWRKNVGAVMQDGYIFSDNIINNVALGDKTPSVDRVRKSLRIACADFVFELPTGMHTKIGAEGISLSSGQRQRILIARAVYKNPSIFFLDEATNACDAINERNIYDNLHHVLSGKTVVIAAHRLSTISKADQILVFDRGQIVECGTHATLLKQNGKYASLIRNQRFE